MNRGIFGTGMRFTSSYYPDRHGCHTKRLQQNNTPLIAHFANIVLSQIDSYDPQQPHETRLANYPGTPQCEPRVESNGLKVLPVGIGFAARRIFLVLSDVVELDVDTGNESPNLPHR